MTVRGIVCGARIRLSPAHIMAVMDVRSDLERVLWDITGEPRCVLESHPDIYSHWGIARLLPSRPDIWATWADELQLHAVQQWPMCTRTRTGARCDCPRGHRGRCSFNQLDYARGIRSWRPLSGSIHKPEQHL